jgi:hypothetical protein
VSFHFLSQISLIPRRSLSTPSVSSSAVHTARAGLLLLRRRSNTHACRPPPLPPPPLYCARRPPPPPPPPHWDKIEAIYIGNVDRLTLIVFLVKYQYYPKGFIGIFHLVISLITCMLWFSIYNHPIILFYTFMLWLTCNSFDYLENKINCFVSDILFALII